MNAYYERTNRTATIENVKPLDLSFIDKIISVICAVVAFFTSAVAIKVEKATVCTAGFVAFFGIIGGIELGSISMLMGVILCAVISIVEIFVLKSLFKKKAADQ